MHRHFPPLLALLVVCHSAICPSACPFQFAVLFVKPSSGADVLTEVTIVCGFGAILPLAALLKPLILSSGRWQLLRRSSSFLVMGTLTIDLSSEIGLTVYQKGDQPLLNWLEMTHPNLQHVFLPAPEQDYLQQAGAGVG